MRSIVFKPTTSAVITRFTTAALLLLALAACYVDGDPLKDKIITFKPIVLAAIGVDQGVDISWNAVSGATSYTVYYHTASFNQTSDSGVKSETAITATNTIITGLTNGTKYYLRVESINANNGDKGLSAEITATANLQTPTNVIATGGDKIVVISWDAVTGATGYNVYYRTKSFTSTTGVPDKTGITTTSTIITGLANGTEYYLRVEVINADGDKKLSKVVTATTKATATANLQAPTNVKATGGDKIVDISWSAVTGATSYTVYYNTASFSSTAGLPFRTVQSPALSTSITGLANGTLYYLRVESINADGETKLSEEVSVTPTTIKLFAPQPSAAASISLAAVDLSWDAMVDVIGYKIYYAEQSLDGLNGGYINYRSVGGKLEITTNTSATIGDLSADTLYYFVVSANYDGKESAASEVIARSSYIAELAMGGNHGCVRLNTGSIKCWGGNIDGQLGLGNRHDRNTATSVPGMLAKQLSAGYSHSCAIDFSDRLYCWGSNGYFKLGISGYGRSSPTLVEQANLAKVSLVTAGSTSTCALANDNNYCWGDQWRGGLGNGVNSHKSTPIAQKINDITPDVKQFALGVDSGCAIDASNDLWCWGSNYYGQVGDGTTTDRPSPVKLSLQDGSTATMVAGKYTHYCAVDDAKKIQCWGQNHRGQLGINSKTDSNSPQYVLASPKKSDPLTGVSKVVTGHWYSCALLIKDGRVRCWGEGSSKIGIAGGAHRLIADTDMKGINNAIDIAAGYEHICVLLADRARVKCWGRNEYGQLGDDTGTDSHTPVEVKGL